MRVETRRGLRFTSRLFYNVYRNNAVKEGKSGRRSGGVKKLTKKKLFIMVLCIPSLHSQCLVS